MLQSHLGKFTECILNNNLSILLIIKLYTFFIFAVCNADLGLEMDTTSDTCVCAVGYYQDCSSWLQVQPLLSALPVHLEEQQWSTNSQAIDDMW